VVPWTLALSSWLLWFPFPPTAKRCCPRNVTIRIPLPTPRLGQAEGCASESGWPLSCACGQGRAVDFSGWFLRQGSRPAPSTQDTKSGSSRCSSSIFATFLWARPKASTLNSVRIHGYRQRLNCSQPQIVYHAEMGKQLKVPALLRGK
jgi:hypothetical protein